MFRTQWQGDALAITTTAGEAIHLRLVAPTNRDFTDSTPLVVTFTHDFELPPYMWDIVDHTTDTLVDVEAMLPTLSTLSFQPTVNYIWSFAMIDDATGDRVTLATGPFVVATSDSL